MSGTGNSFYTFQNIEPTECMGDSLFKIRNNDSQAADAIGSLETRIATVSADLNTRINTATTTLSTVPYARLNDGNQTGVAPIYGCRAWVTFDMTRDASGISNTLNTNRFIYAAGNVSSVLRNSASEVQVNFTVNMPDVNYAVAANSDRNDGAFAKQPPSIQGGTTDNLVNVSWVKMYISNPELSRRVCVMVFR